MVCGLAQSVEFIVNFLPFEVNLVVIILDRAGSYFIRPSPAVGDIMIAIPSLSVLLVVVWVIRIFYYFCS